jgi:hypothetical protein
MTDLRDLSPLRQDDAKFQQAVCSTRQHRTPTHFPIHIRFTNTRSPLFTLIFVREQERERSLQPSSFPQNRHQRQRPHRSILIMRPTLLSPVQLQLQRDQTLHPSVSCLLSLRARHPLSFPRAQHPFLLLHPLPALIPSHLHLCPLQKSPIIQPLSCNNLSKPAKQLKMQSASRRSANRSVFYRF